MEYFNFLLENAMVEVLEHVTARHKWYKIKKKPTIYSIAKKIEKNLKKVLTKGNVYGNII